MVPGAWTEMSADPNPNRESAAIAFPLTSKVTGTSVGLPSIVTRAVKLGGCPTWYRYAMTSRPTVATIQNGKNALKNEGRRSEVVADELIAKKSAWSITTDRLVLSSICHKKFAGYRQPAGSLAEEAEKQVRKRGKA
jgi:hypothetical protein